MAKGKPGRKPKKPKVNAMDLKAIIVAFLQVAVNFVPPPFNYFLPWLLDYLLPMVDSKKVMAAHAAPMFAAPDELRIWLTSFLTDAVNRIQRPLIRRILQVVVNNLSDDLINAVWDALIGKNIIGGPAASTFTPDESRTRTLGGPPPTEAELLADVEAELAAA